MADKSVKVVMLGDTGVGKSSIAHRFASGDFKPYSESTIGASFLSKTIEVPIVNRVSDNTDDNGEAETPSKRTERLNEPSSRRIEFRIWDTAGQEKYHSLAPLYYRNALASIVIYDLCNKYTFTTLKKWVSELNKNGPPDIVLAIVGNKSDLAEHRQVAFEDAKKYANKIGAFYIETSARDNFNVKVLFEQIAIRLPESFFNENDGQHLGSINLSQVAIQDKSGCCTSG